MHLGLSDYEVGRWFQMLIEKFPDKYPNQQTIADKFKISRQLVGFLIQHYEAIEQFKKSLPPNIATRVAMLPERFTREVRCTPEEISVKS